MLARLQRPAKSVRQRSGAAIGEACKNTTADGTATLFSSVTVIRMLRGVVAGDLAEVCASARWTGKIQTAKYSNDVRNRSNPCINTWLYFLRWRAGGKRNYFLAAFTRMILAVAVCAWSGSTFRGRSRLPFLAGANRLRGLAGRESSGRTLRLRIPP